MSEFNPSPAAEAEVAKLQHPRQALRLVNGLRGTAQAERQVDLLWAALARWPKDLRLNLRMAELHRQRQDFRTAIRILSFLYLEHPTAVRPRVALADLLMQIFADADAVVYLEEALELRPNSIAILRRLACCLYRQKRDAEAEPRYVHWLRLTPVEPRAMMDLVYLYVRNGRLQEAEHMLQSVVGIAPGHVDAVGELASVLCMLRRFEEAEKLLRDALAKDDRVLHHRLLGGVLVETRRYAEAESILRECCERDPLDTFTLAKLATLYLETGRPKEAEEFARRALDPNQLIAADIIQAIVVPRLNEQALKVHQEIQAAIGDHNLANPAPASLSLQPGTVH